MARWIIKYTDKYDDLSSVWVEASSREDAINQVKREYWDVADIVDAYKA